MLDPCAPLAVARQTLPAPDFVSQLIIEAITVPVRSGSILNVAIKIYLLV